MPTITEPQPATAAAKGRIPYFDLLKGVAIFMVVMGHALTMCIRGIDSAFAFKLIAQVHMPVFFFISGYFTYKATAAEAWARPDLKKRFCQLIIPFLTMSTLWTVYFPHCPLQSPLATNLPDMLQSYWKSGYWFTLCLFELMLVYWLLCFALSRIRRTSLQVVVMLVVYAVLVALSVNYADEDANVDWVGFGLLAQFYPVFMIGAMAHKLRGAFEAACHSQTCITVSILAFAVIWYAIVYPWDMPWADNVPLTAAVRFVAMPVMHFALMIVMISLAEAWSSREMHPGVTPGVATRYFNWLGRESLAIYVCHYFFLFPLAPLQEPMRQLGLSTVPLLVTAAVVAFAVIAVTMLAVAVIKRSRLLAFLLIGKSMK